MRFLSFDRKVIFAFILLCSLKGSFSINPARSIKKIANKIAFNTKLNLSIQASAPVTNVKELNGLELCLCGAFATIFGDFVVM